MNVWQGFNHVKWVGIGRIDEGTDLNRTVFDDVYLKVITKYLF